MRKLVVFNQVSLDGYFSGEKGDISWAHQAGNDLEWKEFVEENATAGGVLLFGRITYDLMKSYWPTPEAIKNDPIVSERMNNLPKVVFSRTLEKASWNNAKLVKGEPVTEVRKMKKEPGKDMVIFGSGSIIAQLAQANLIDEYQFVVIPVVLGKGRTMFDGIKQKMTMKPTKSRSFSNGSLLLCYEPKG
jgi:dihydrofolate reductase